MVYSRIKINFIHPAYNYTQEVPIHTCVLWPNQKGLLFGMDFTTLLNHDSDFDTCGVYRLNAIASMIEMTPPQPTDVIMDIRYATCAFYGTQ